jgi:hypothetical protein
MPTEKIIMVDRVPEKLSVEEMKTIKDEYTAYCVNTYKAVQNLDIANKDAKDIVFDHILSPLQYFIEDKVRIKRLDENRLEGGQQQRPQYQAPVQQNNRQAPVQAPVQEKPKWKNRF